MSTNIRNSRADQGVSATSNSASDAAARSGRRLRYRAPTRGFVAYMVAVMILTYLALTTELMHPSKDRMLPRFLRKPAHQYKFLYLIPMLLEKAGINMVYKTTCMICGGLKGLQMIVAITWLTHIAEAAYALYECMMHNATMETMVRYTLGILLGGCTQFFPLRSAIKEVRPHTD